jgi:hypothetical protein
VKSVTPPLSLTHIISEIRVENEAPYSQQQQMDPIPEQNNE